MQLTPIKEHLVAVRRQLDHERVALDAKIELLDQLLGLVDDDTPAEKDGLIDESAHEPIPPPTRRPQQRRTPLHSGSETMDPPAGPELETLLIGDGPTKVKTETNLGSVVQALKGRGGHWMTATGIVEAITAQGIRPATDLPRNFVEVVGQSLRALRSHKYAVPGLETRKDGKRYEYRIQVPSKVKT